MLGWPDADIFIELPVDALALLDWLAAGQTIEQAQASYHARYGETPDVVDLLEQLEASGLVQVGQHPPTAFSPAQITDALSWMPVSLCRMMWSPPALVLYVALMLAALLGALLTPGAIPNWRSLFVGPHLTALGVLLMVAGLGITAVHEFAHASAARARDVPVRFSLGRRLWNWVVQTDMTPIWGLPRRARYLPMLAGIIVDLVIAALLVLTLVGDRRGLFTLPDGARLALQALTFSYLLTTLPQLYFFVRTDLYFVMTNALGCKNLMGDTEGYLRNQLARRRNRPAVVDQSQLPAHEARVVRFYAWIWVLGRLAALATLALVTLPLLWTYSRSILTALSHGYEATPIAFLDALGALVLGITPQLLGLLAWGRHFRTEDKAYDVR